MRIQLKKLTYSIIRKQAPHLCTRSMYTIYGIKNCNTMQKAFALLDELGIAYTFHDYKKTPIDADTLTYWLATLGSEVVINRKGTTWRGLSSL